MCRSRKIQCVPVFLVASVVLGPNALVGPRSLHGQIEWNQPDPNPALAPALPPAWDSVRLLNPTVLSKDGEFFLWYWSGVSGQSGDVGLAFSDFATPLQRAATDPVLSPVPGTWESFNVDAGQVLYDPVENLYRMYYWARNEAAICQIGLATSTDGLNWVRAAGNPFVPADAAWERNCIGPPCVVRKDGTFHMWYTGGEFANDLSVTWRIGYATSKDGEVWLKRDSPLDIGGTERLGFLLETVLYDPGTQSFEMWYDFPVQRVGTPFNVGYATSLDGIVWESRPATVQVEGLAGQQWEHPTVLRDGDHYQMWFSVPPNLGGGIHYATSERTIPTASFTVTPQGEEGSSIVHLDAGLSSTPNEGITSYRWDFDDGSSTDTVEGTETHTYCTPGEYRITLTVTDDAGNTGSVARKAVVTPAGLAGPCFRRGATNGDGRLDMADAVFTLTYLFTGGDSPGCLQAADVNRDLGLNVTDPIYLLSYLFLGGPPPAPPFAACGQDLSPLSCKAATECHLRGAPNPGQ